jgi:hypothetical protein
MLAPPRRLRALTLLLAGLAQPAWAFAHTVVHQHLAQHHEEAAHSHTAGVSDVSASEAQQAASTPGFHDHDHDHDHLVAVFIRPTRSSDSPSLAALPSAAPRPYVVTPRQWAINREGAPSRASPEASGPSDPRAPPIA